MDVQSLAIAHGKKVRKFDHGDTEARRRKREENVRFALNGAPPAGSLQAMQNVVPSLRC